MLILHDRYIQWVGVSPSHNSPIKVEARLFNSLFDRDESESHPDGFLAALNPKSEEIFPNAMIENGLEEIRSRAPWPAKEGEKGLDSTIHQESVRFQALRTAYFCLDSDSTPERPILNRIVSLKEDTGK